jgi:hypothetical protein
VILRALKVVIYSALAVAGVAMIYSRIAEVFKDGSSGVVEWIFIGLWGAAGLYILIYVFMLAAEVVWGKRHRLLYDAVIVAVFCGALLGRLLGI